MCPCDHASKRIHPKQLKKRQRQTKGKKEEVRVAMDNQLTSMEFLLLEEVQFLEANDDALSQWEFVNVLEVDEGGEKDDDRDSVEDGFGSWNSEISWSSSPNIGPIEGEYCHLHSDAKVKDPHCDANDDGTVDRHLDDVDVESNGYQFDDGAADGYGGGQVDEETEDDDDVNGYDLDDELVPWSVSNKFGRQRMRKLGKRAFSKMQNSKRSPYLFVRPGCVRGKHGLGLKHNY